jgi:hypothetical protein
VKEIQEAERLGVDPLEPGALERAEAGAELKTEKS